MATLKLFVNEQKKVCYSTSTSTNNTYEKQLRRDGWTPVGTIEAWNIKRGRGNLKPMMEILFPRRRNAHQV